LSPYYVAEDLEKEQVENWLRMAMCNEFNIYKNSNKTIALLCYELLKRWEDNEKK